MLLSAAAVLMLLGGQADFARPRRMPTARLRRDRRQRAICLTLIPFSPMLNATFYLFGAGAYRNYAFPKDKSLNCFAKVRRCTHTPSALLAHREGEIMYYTYILRLSGQNGAFGVGLVLNGVAVSDHRALFSFFDRVVGAALFTRGLLILGEGGDLWMNPKKIGSRASVVRELLNDLSSYWAAEHPVSTRLSAPKLDVKADATRYFGYNEKPEVVWDATMRMPWVSVTRQQMGIPGLEAWTQHVAKHKAEIGGWQARVKEREKEINKLKSQADVPIGWFIYFLICLLIACGLLLYSLHNANSDAESAKHNAEQYQKYFRTVVGQRDSLQRELNDVGD